MYFILEKSLQRLFWPESIAISFFVLSGVSLKLNRPALAFKVLVLGLIALIVPSLPLTARFLMTHLENRFPVQVTDQYPNADVIVVLGGSTGSLQAPRKEPEEVTGSRILPAARLFKAGKAPWVMVCGGFPYIDSYGRKRTMADDIQQILIEEGVPRTAILQEDKSRTTREDAEYSQFIFKTHRFKKILLVTSAFHQRRAAALFERTGVEVTPVPVAHEVTASPLYWEFLTPDATSLMLTTVALKEYLGYAVDRLFLKP